MTDQVDEITDGEPSQFDKLNMAIEDAPLTWIPELMSTLIKSALERRVFKPGGLFTFVKASHDAWKVKNDDNVSNNTTVGDLLSDDAEGRETDVNSGLNEVIEQASVEAAERDVDQIMGKITKIDISVEGQRATIKFHLDNGQQSTLNCDLIDYLSNDNPNPPADDLDDMDAIGDIPGIVKLLREFDGTFLPHLIYWMKEQTHDPKDDDGEFVTIAESRGSPVDDGSVN